MFVPYLNYYYKGLDALNPGNSIAIKVVATLGYSGDWAAYRGLSHEDDQEIAESGDKLSKEAAEALFPSFKNAGLRYRK